MNDRSSDEHKKFLASLSYILIMMLVGVPIWWKTTQVYRVTLPHASIDRLSESTKSFKFKTIVELVSSRVDDIGPKFQKFITQDSEIYDVMLSSRLPTVNEDDALENSNTLFEFDNLLFSLQRGVFPGKIIAFEVPAVSHLLGDENIVIGAHRTVFFKADSISLSTLSHLIRQEILGESSMISLVQSFDHKCMNKDEDLFKGGVRTSNGYDLLFSLLVPEPMKSKKISWNMADYIDQVIKPFLRELSPLSCNFTVTSQILYLTSLNLSPVQNGNVKMITESDLRLAINPIEARLASYVSSNPSLNFLTYVSTLDQSPLRIMMTNMTTLESNAFLIPRWGGVVIVNQEKSNINVEDHVGPVFLAQLRSLLGLGTDNGYFVSSVSDKMWLLPQYINGIRIWEKEYLFRFRTLDNILNVKSTLQSLARLLSQISNIIIVDEIGQKVEQSTLDAFEAISLAERGLLMQALMYSQSAFSDSETAFFDPTLLGLLYFPEDQKYAVYIPLFLPVAIPIIMSLKSIFLYIRQNYKL